MYPTASTPENLAFRPFANVRPSTGPRVLDLLRRAERAIDCDRAHTRHLLSSALALLDERKVGEGSEGSCPPLDGSPLRLAAWQQRAVRTHVAAHVGEAISMGSLAALVRLSPSHFCKVFKASFGLTPHAYVTRERVAHAQRVMLSTDTSLSEIALDLGFADQAHFCRTFRKIVGEAPQRWRRAHRGGVQAAA